jgi:hypothetical protein
MTAWTSTSRCTRDRERPGLPGEGGARPALADCGILTLHVRPRVVACHGLGRLGCDPARIRTDHAQAELPNDDALFIVRMAVFAIWLVTTARHDTSLALAAQPGGLIERTRGGWPRSVRGCVASSRRGAGAFAARRVRARRRTATNSQAHDGLDVAGRWSRPACCARGPLAW